MLALEQRNTKLAFIGLGNMGSRIAGRLLAAGFGVSVFNRLKIRNAEGGPRFP